MAHVRRELDDGKQSIRAIIDVHNRKITNKFGKHPLMLINLAFRLAFCTCFVQLKLMMGKYVQKMIKIKLVSK